MKNKTDFFAYVISATVALILVIYSLFLETWSAKILPLVIASIIFIVAAVGAIRSGRMASAGATNGGQSGDAGGSSTESEGTWRSLIPITVWLVSYFVGITLVGFLIASPLFLLSYMKTHGSGWRRSIVVTVVTFAVIYGMFVVGFKVDLYEGIIFQ